MTYAPCIAGECTTCDRERRRVLPRPHVAGTSGDKRTRRYRVTLERAVAFAAAELGVDVEDLLELGRTHA